MTPLKRGRAIWALKYIVLGFVRAVVIAWAMDALRPDLPWLPHLTWWGVWLVLLILGSALSDLIGVVLVSISDWLDRYGAETERSGGAS